MKTEMFAHFAHETLNFVFIHNKARQNSALTEAVTNWTQLYSSSLRMTPK